MNGSSPDNRLNSRHDPGRVWLAAFICYLVAGLITGCALALTARFSASVIDLSQVRGLYTVPLFTFAPEPVERRLFLSGIVIFPVVLAAAWPVVMHAVNRPGSGRLQAALRWCAGLTAVAASVGVTVYGIVCVPFLAKDISRYTVCCSLLLSAAFVVFLRAGRGRSLPGLPFDIAAGALIIFTSAYALFGIGGVADTPAYNVHFNTVFHAMVQVFNGRELLVDLTSQYGLYPHFLEPLFRVTGLSVLSFTIVMSLLTAASYGLIYAVMKEEVRSGPLAFLGLTAVLYFSYVIMRVDLTDPFLQYNPIRQIFPALTLFLTYRYLKRPSIPLYLVQFVVCSVAVLWNTDTGVVSFLSWLLVLLYLESRRPTVAGILRHLLYGGAIFAAVIALFSLCLKVRFGTFPDYSLMLVNQKMFYIYGFMMVPMPLFHPWNLLMVVYMAGLTYAVAGRRGAFDAHLPAFVFYLSVLGVGLFSYYQGRSVDHCLTLVSYPAFILLALYAGCVLSGNGGVPGIILSAGAGVAVAVFFAALLAYARVGGKFSSDIADRLNATMNAAASPVVTDAGFVARHTKPGEQVLILSNLSSIYYLVSGTACPVKIPSPTELFLLDDYDKIVSYLTGPAPGKVIMDANFGQQPYSDEPPPQNAPVYAALAARYALTGISPSGKLRVYLPR